MCLQKSRYVWKQFMNIFPARLREDKCFVDIAEKEKLYLTNGCKWGNIHKLVAIATDMEKSRSWPSAHDWKSCIPQKGIEGSNPSFSARNTPEHTSSGVFFFDFCDFQFSQIRECTCKCYHRPFNSLSIADTAPSCISGRT